VTTPNCEQCAFAGAEPDSDLVCFHPELLKEHLFGLHARYTDRRHFPACGPEGLKFEQHPLRHVPQQQKGGESVQESTDEDRWRMEARGVCDYAGRFGTGGLLEEYVIAVLRAVVGARDSAIRRERDKEIAEFLRREANVPVNAFVEGHALLLASVRQLAEQIEKGWVK